MMRRRQPNNCHRGVAKAAPLYYYKYIKQTHTMKWDIWVQPNQIITEQYPDGWSHQDVMRAANNRYGGKVTTVSPAGDSGSSRSASAPSVGGGGCGSFLGLLVLGIVIIAAMTGCAERQNIPSTPPESLSQPQSLVVPSTPADPSL